MTAPTPKTRGDAILAVIQATRGYHHEARKQMVPTTPFDEAHAVIERLQADGYLRNLPAAA